MTEFITKNYTQFFLFSFDFFQKNNILQLHIIIYSIKINKKGCDSLIC